MCLIEFPFTIEDIRSNHFALKRFKGMWAFEFEDTTLIADPDNKVPYRWDHLEDAKRDLGDVIKKEIL